SQGWRTTTLSSEAVSSSYSSHGTCCCMALRVDTLKSALRPLIAQPTRKSIGEITMSMRNLILSSAVALSILTLADFPAAAQQQQRPPNILVIMGDDVGWFNIGAYHRGMMSGKTPNLDKLASEGMMFTDYY